MTEEPLVILNCDECWPQTTDGKAPSGDVSYSTVEKASYYCNKDGKPPDAESYSDSGSYQFVGPVILGFSGELISGDPSGCFETTECVRGNNRHTINQVVITNAPKGTVFKARLEIDWYYAKNIMKDPGGEGGACVDASEFRYTHTEVQILEIIAGKETTVEVSCGQDTYFSAWLTACQCDCYENEE